MHTQTRRRALRWLLLGAGLLCVASQWACPACIVYPLEAAVEGAEPGDVVEWARGEGAFQPCSATGSTFSCGAPLDWGACGPDASDYQGTYIVRVTRGDRETQESIQVKDLSCSYPERVVLNAYNL